MFLETKDVKLCIKCDINIPCKGKICDKCRQLKEREYSARRRSIDRIKYEDFKDATCDDPIWPRIQEKIIFSLRKGPKSVRELEKDCSIIKIGIINALCLLDDKEIVIFNCLDNKWYLTEGLKKISHRLYTKEEIRYE